MLQPALIRAVPRFAAEAARWLIFITTFSLLSRCISWNSPDGARHTLVLDLVFRKTAPDPSAPGQPLTLAGQAPPPKPIQGKRALVRRTETSKKGEASWVT